MTTDLELTLDSLVARAPVDRADWNDVVRRARRPRRQRAAVLASVVALLTILVSTPALGIGSRLLGLFNNGTLVPSTRVVSARSLWELGALQHKGVPSAPAPSDRALRTIGPNKIRILATRDGVTFYSLGFKSVGVPCFGIGKAANHPPLFLGAIKCAEGFPSQKLPILDWTPFVGSPPSSNAAPCCVWRLAGLAVNDVAEVALIGEDGKLEAVTPVEDNIYIRTTHLPKSPVRAIVALDDKGTRLYCEPLAPKGCR